MRFGILAALVATVAASPLGESLQPRAGCALGSATVGGKSAKGPFKLVSGGSFSKAGQYASFRRVGATVTFDIPASKAANANEFYLGSDGRLLSNDDGGVEVGYELQPNGAGAVKIGTGNHVLSCRQGPSCSLDCEVNGFSYNCLSSPGYKPDWRISADAGSAGRSCIAFTPKIVAG